MRTMAAGMLEKVKKKAITTKITITLFSLCDIVNDFLRASLLLCNFPTKSGNYETVTMSTMACQLKSDITFGLNIGGGVVAGSLGF